MTRYWMTNSDRVAARDDMVTEQERTVCRPVVVIDPEDGMQVDRLVDAVLAHGYRFTGTYSDMRAALRSLIAPPKPPEPTGLGAVVEDDKGRRFVRFTSHDIKACWRVNYLDAATYPWSEIDAVKVLSQGVTR